MVGKNPIDITGIRIKLNSITPMNHFAETEIELSQDNYEQSWVITKESKDSHGKNSLSKALQIAVVEEALIKFASSGLSPIPNFHFGRDGTTYTLEIMQGCCSVRYNWWTIVPDGYEPVRDLVKQLHEWVE
jgi:hypothetical protein